MRADTPHDLGRAIAQDAELGAGRVILGQLADAIEQRGAGRIVKVFRRNAARRTRQPVDQVALERARPRIAGGLLAGYFFLMAKPKGPPFGIERAELDALLTPHFELVEDLPVTDSLPVFEGNERWLTWRRR